MRRSTRIAPALRFDVIDDPLEEGSCDDTIEPPLGSSFDDFVTYVAGLPMNDDHGGTTDVTVDGYRGKHLEYSPGEEDDVDCPCPTTKTSGSSTSTAFS